jgi:hypothetical protein
MVVFVLVLTLVIAQESAVAVAANLCVVAVGTETDGSVVCPSAVSGM